MKDGRWRFAYRHPGQPWRYGTHKDEATAKKKARQKAFEIQSGAVAKDSPDATERRLARTIREAAEEQGLSADRMLGDFLDYLQSLGQSRPLSEVVNELLSLKGGQGLADRTVSDLRQKPGPSD